MAPVVQSSLKPPATNVLMPLPLPALPPAHNSLAALSSSLHKELADAGIDSAHISIEHITNLLKQYTADDYTPYAQHDPSKPYTRSLLDDGNGFFNLMVLVWTPGGGSPVHDHAGSHCLMKMLDGELSETLYSVPQPGDDERVDSGNEDACEDDDSGDNGQGGLHCSTQQHGMRVRRLARLATGDVAYIHDRIGLHKIANPSPAKRAVSLHLYTPPFEFCRTYNETTGEARASGRCTFFRNYSKRGTDYVVNVERVAESAVVAAGSTEACGI
ncbi:Cysteine dioxygenase [Geranomyces michiganensis]|nr:Cysteine dioxygenase [Geranomyces michiganensis]